MTGDEQGTLSPKMREAIEELQTLVLTRYPEAVFSVNRAPDEPDAICLTAVVDVDEPDEVIDLTIDRVMQFQIEDELPIWLVPVRTPERVAALFALQSDASPERAMALG